MNDYINASLITVEETQRKYILTQVSAEKTNAVKLKNLIIKKSFKHCLETNDQRRDI